MNDPRLSDQDPRLDPRFSPTSSSTKSAADETTGWVLPTVIAGLAVAGLAAFLMMGDFGSSDGPKTAATTPPETTGRAFHPPVPPTRVSPNRDASAPLDPGNQ